MKIVIVIMHWEYYGIEDFKGSGLYATGLVVHGLEYMCQVQKQCIFQYVEVLMILTRVSYK